MKNSIHFLGASGSVTGSKYLLQISGKKILIDCGLFQGLKNLRELNWEYLPIKASEIDAVLLTHGHLDHVGYVPRLVKMGYKGPIYGTSPTLEIAGIILLDSGRIQEESAEKANEEGFTKHEPAEALYTEKEAEAAIEHFQSMPEGDWVDLFDDIKVRFQYNGHILGATFIEIEAAGKRFVFSGDIGRKEDYLLRSPKKPVKADYLFLETTYGDRLHPNEDIEQMLIDIISRTIAKGGSLLIPSFAVERTQTLMFILSKLKKENRIPNIPMFMDSPMGDRVLKVFKSNQIWHKRSHQEVDEMIENFRIVKKYEETWEIIDNPESKIVIAGSGMITGGRILTYLKQYLDRPETSVLLVGYQAEGTRGRALLEGAAELKIQGKYIPVKAEIFNSQSLSSHADQMELLDWLSEMQLQPEKTFLIHGENLARDAFRLKLKDTLNWSCELPELWSIVEI
ncbi:MAG: MBL fold metallo-hydrolase [Crocinitomicaceae bacterium]